MILATFQTFLNDESIVHKNAVGRKLPALTIPVRLRGPIKKKFLFPLVTPVIAGEFGIE